MGADPVILYHDYSISIVQADRRFTALVTRSGALIQHDGRSSERWSSHSCASFDRAVTVAKAAIDSDEIR